MLERLRRFVTSLVPLVPPDEVEGVIQETWRRWLRTPMARRGLVDLRWKCGTARNVARERRRARRPRSLDRVPDASEIPASQQQAQPPQEALERSETRAIVAVALRSLPRRLRSALIQRYLQNRPVAEIAKRGGTTVKAMEHQLDHGRRALRRACARAGLVG